MDEIPLCHCKYREAMNPARPCNWSFVGRIFKLQALVSYLCRRTPSERLNLCDPGRAQPGRGEASLIIHIYLCYLSSSTLKAPNPTAPRGPPPFHYFDIVGEEWVLQDIVDFSCDIVVDEVRT